MKIRFLKDKTFVVNGQAIGYKAGQLVTSPLELPNWAADLFVRNKAAEIVSHPAPRDAVENRDPGPAPENREADT